MPPAGPYSFPKEEHVVLQYWRDIDAFQTSLKQSEGKPRFTFYDGPPFATGLPHYGHLLAGTIKVSSTRPSAPPTSLLFAHMATFAEKTEGDEMRV